MPGVVRAKIHAFGLPLWVAGVSGDETHARALPLAHHLRGALEIHDEYHAFFHVFKRLVAAVGQNGVGEGGVRAPDERKIAGSQRSRGPNGAHLRGLDDRVRGRADPLAEDVVAAEPLAEPTRRASCFIVRVAGGGRRDARVAATARRPRTPPRAVATAVALAAAML